MAAQKTFMLIVSRVEGLVYSGEALSVTVPGVEGEMTLLAGHEPLISPLRAGKVTIRTTDREETIEIASGTLEVSAGQATILI